MKNNKSFWFFYVANYELNLRIAFINLREGERWGARNVSKVLSVEMSSPCMAFYRQGRWQQGGFMERSGDPPPLAPFVMPLRAIALWMPNKIERW